jgi:hypothetical protein
MTRVIRYEFIGKDQNGDTVYGHKFAPGVHSVEAWLDEQQIHNRVVAFCGLVPEDFILEYDTVSALWQKFQGNIEIIHQANAMILDIARTSEVDSTDSPPPVKDEPCSTFNHKWKKEYYGVRCEKCDLFYPDGCAPWEDETI